MRTQKGGLCPLFFCCKSSIDKRGGALFEELYFAGLLAYSDEMASIIVSL